MCSSCNWQKRQTKFQQSKSCQNVAWSDFAAVKKSRVDAYLLYFFNCESFTLAILWSCNLHIYQKDAEKFKISVIIFSLVNYMYEN